MGRSRAAPPPNDKLTISRIHHLLRPFEMNLNALAKILENKIAEDKYAPKPRQPGITYAKRYRIRAMTGMTSQQAGRAYALEKSKGLSTLYSFHKELIGVEDTFRNLIRGSIASQGPSRAAARVPTLRAMVCQMIGLQVAEETLRDKEELEAEGVQDCIGLWYGDLPVPCRKFALVAHAVQLVELKIPFFILELWKGLLSITMQAGLYEESCILLEYILLYYFTLDDSTSKGACPAANMAGRDLTDLYNQLTDISLHSLPPGEFFAILLPIIEASPCATKIWNFRCIHHLMRNIDEDVVLMARIGDSMARTWMQSQPAKEEVENLARLMETKIYGVLTLLTALYSVGVSSDSEAISSELVSEIGHLAWTTHHTGKSHSSTQLLGISLALDIVMLLLVSRHSTFPPLDSSDAIERLKQVESLKGNDKSAVDVHETLVKALHSAQPTQLFGYRKKSSEAGSANSTCSSPRGADTRKSTSFLEECIGVLLVYGLDTLAKSLQQHMEEMTSRGDAMRLCIVPAPSGELKRPRKGKGPHFATKRRRLQARWKDGQSGGGAETSCTESEVTTEWSASVSGEDSAGEQQEQGEDEVEGEERYVAVENSQGWSSAEEAEESGVVAESQSMKDDDEENDAEVVDEEDEELEDDSDVETRRSYSKYSNSRPVQPSNRTTYASTLMFRPPLTRFPNNSTRNSKASTNANGITGSVNGSATSTQPAPVLRSVMTSKRASEMFARLARRTREEERDRAREAMTSSDDDLDLLRGWDRERGIMNGTNGKVVGRRESAPQAEDSEGCSTP